MSDQPEVFTFPKTRKSRVGKSFIAEIRKSQSSNDDLNRLSEEATAEIARLDAIISDQENHSAAELIDARLRLPVAKEYARGLYFDANATRRESFDHYARKHLSGVIEHAIEEVTAAGNQELADLRKSLPKGVSIDPRGLDSPAIQAHRQLTTYCDQNAQARYLYDALTV